MGVVLPCLVVDNVISQTIEFTISRGAEISERLSIYHSFSSVFYTLRGIRCKRQPQRLLSSILPSASRFAHHPGATNVVAAKLDDNQRAFVFAITERVAMNAG